MKNQSGYVKVHWTNGGDKTAGLIFKEDELNSLSITELSRRWPNSEATKMKKVIRSKVFPTWKKAFSS